MLTDGESNQNNGTEAVELAELGIVYDLFLAQFRSTLTCPVCHKQSSKLDPLLLVPLPISEKYKMPVFATVVRWRTVPPQVLQVAALLSTCDMVSDLRSRIATLTQVAAEQASFCQLLSHNLVTFSRPNGAWLFTADVTFIYVSIRNGLILTRR